MSAAPLDRFVDVDGAQIRFSVTGSGAHDLLLVHGAGAHHLWFMRMVDDLLADHRVITLDISGHGHSDHRSAYSVELWAKELAAVLDAAAAGPAIVCGHSMGARIGIALTATRPELVSRVVMLDGNIRAPEEFPRPGERPAPREHRVYATREEAIDRFRLMPPQRGPAPELLVPLAEYSVVEVEGGWSWRHDWSSPTEPYDEYINACVQRLQAPVTFVYGTESPIVNARKAEYFVSLASAPVQVIAIDGGEHHLMLDRPDECAAAIRA